MFFSTHLSDRIRAQPQWLIVAEALLAVVLLGVVDYVTGYDVSIFVLYAAPILYVVWFSGRKAGCFICVACAVAWAIADFSSRHPYSDNRILVWNTALQLGFFLFAMLCGSALKFQFEQSQAQITQFQRFQILAEISPVGIFRTGPDGGCLYVNDRWCEISGQTQAQALGPRWTAALHRDDAERVAGEWARAVSEEGRFQFEGRFQHGDGRTVWALGQVAVERSADGQVCGYVGAITDLSEQRRLEREILQISEREQQRIGQDLHDDLCQFLAAIQYTAVSHRRDLQRQSRSEAGTAQELSDLLKEAVVRTRNLARGIFPVKLDEMGLVSALHEFAATVSRAFGLTCTFACDPPVSIDDSTAATHLYRIAQEAVNNSIKHGHARRVMILLSGDSDWITLAVADDGAGLPATFPATGDGMGVRIMEHRARMIGGTLQISRLERGTRVACSFRKRRGIVRALPAGEAAAA